MLLVDIPYYANVPYV